MTLDRTDLDLMAAAGCQVEGCGHKHHGPVFLAQRCHPGAGTAASYSAGSGVLRVACQRCGKLVAEIAVAG